MLERIFTIPLYLLFVATNNGKEGTKIGKNRIYQDDLNSTSRRPSFPSLLRGMLLELSSIFTGRLSTSTPAEVNEPSKRKFRTSGSSMFRTTFGNVVGKWEITGVPFPWRTIDNPFARERNRTN